MTEIPEKLRSLIQALSFMRYPPASQEFIGGSSFIQYRADHHIVSVRPLGSLHYAGSGTSYRHVLAGEFMTFSFMLSPVHNSRIVFRFMPFDDGRPRPELQLVANGMSVELGFDVIDNFWCYESAAFKPPAALVNAVISSTVETGLRGLAWHDARAFRQT